MSENVSKPPRTVGELKALLAYYNDDTALFVGGPKLAGNDQWKLREMRLEILVGRDGVTQWYIAQEKLTDEEPCTALELK